MHRDRELTMKQHVGLILTALTLLVGSQSAINAAPGAGISSDMAPQAILGTMKAVADWQLAQAPRHREDDWTSAALYTGINSSAA